MISRLKTVGLIINVKALVIAGLAVVSTWLCLTFGVIGEFPLTLIATAVVFPIVFSINSAYKRRESVLDDYGQLKAHGRAIYFAARDWLEEADERRMERCRHLLRDLLTEARNLYAGPRNEMAEREKRVYACFSMLSRFIRIDLREAGLATGEVSRCNQYLSKMLVAFEQTKHIYQYRTPRTLRAFSDVFITVLPPLYGPYFAYLAMEFSPSLAYLMPVLFALVLAALDNIQEHLENPFDQIGQDDVTINAEKFADVLTIGAPGNSAELPDAA
jgi:predicted membrane chloride channel (bestrophin family)